MNISDMRDPAARLGLLGGVQAAITAAAAGDNTAVNSRELDRRSGIGLDAENLIVTVQAQAVLAAGKTLTVPVRIQHTDDDDFNTANNVTTKVLGTIVLTGVAVTGSTEETTRVYACHLGELKNRVRLQIQPDLNAVGTDTAIVAAVAIVGAKQHASGAPDPVNVSTPTAG